MLPDSPEAKPKVIKFLSVKEKNIDKNHFENKVNYFFLFSIKIH
jgi:hypothetical protein